MSDPETWQRENREYLTAALAWLHLRLERLAGPSLTPLAVVGSPPPPPAGRLLFWRPQPPAVPLLPVPGSVTEAQIEEAAARVAAAEDTDPPPALVHLARLLGLSEFERHVLLLCAGVELDGRTGELCARAQVSDQRTPTFSLAMRLFDDPHWEALSPGRPLRHYRLIEIHQPGAQPLTTSPLRCDERIVAYLNGVEDLDDRLAPLVSPFGEVDPGGLAGSQREVADELVAGLLQADSQVQPLPLVQLLGPDRASKELVARLVSQMVGRRLYRLPAEVLPTQATELETVARLWERESLLLPVALYVDAEEVDGRPQADGQAPPVQRFLGRLRGVTFLATHDAWPGLTAQALSADVARPAPAEQREAWEAALQPDPGDDPRRLSSQFSLNLPAIGQVAALAGAVDPDSRSDRLWRACVMRSRPTLENLAQRIEALATWSQLVLPEAETALLHQIAGQVRHRSRVYEDWGFRERMNRGLGISALFAGPSGTGKTMAAEVIANDLQLDLYRIDLSAVVSKYIGETEKNLRRLFDAAEDGGVLLFFDEADALFGRRSEVKDSHDRYANIEINYLLQRMESYRGLAILATNMKSEVDSAFLRRLRFVVKFPFPGTAQRREIWQRVFPPQVSRGELDLDRLARLSLSGGNILSIALNAAFLAAERGTPVTMPLLMEAARSEMSKLEKPINEDYFRLPPNGDEHRQKETV